MEKQIELLLQVFKNNDATLNETKKALLNLLVVAKSLPTKEEIISEGEKQIIDWLEGNTEREKKHFAIGFRRSFEYVQRRLKK